MRTKQRLQSISGSHLHGIKAHLAHVDAPAGFKRHRHAPTRAARVRFNAVVVHSSSAWCELSFIQRHSRFRRWMPSLSVCVRVRMCVCVSTDTQIAKLFFPRIVSCRRWCRHLATAAVVTARNSLWRRLRPPSQQFAARRCCPRLLPSVSQQLIKRSWHRIASLRLAGSESVSVGYHQPPAGRRRVKTLAPGL